jgi:hypothetical protein
VFSPQIVRKKICATTTARSARSRPGAASFRSVATTVALPVMIE